MNGIGDFVASLKETHRLAAQIAIELKGESAGHPFRGNQWTGGGGSASAARVAPYIMQDSPTASLNEMTIRDAKLPETHTDGLGQIRFVEQSYIKATNPAGQSVDAYGTYDPRTKVINLSSNADNIALIGGAVVLHEMGHHVHLSKITDEASREWAGISRNGESCRISAYGRTNQGEHFSEAYRLYARGGTYRAKLRNAEPDSYKFMAKIFKGKGMLPAGEQAQLDWKRYDPNLE